MDRAAFDRCVQAAYDALPAWVKKRLENVVLLVEDRAPQAVLREMGMTRFSELLGLWSPAEDEVPGGPPVVPERIALYRRAILEAAPEEGKTVEALIREVLVHEIAHHFEMTEEEVEKIEREMGLRPESS